MIVLRNVLLLVLGIGLLQAATGERVVRGPEQGDYRGASSGYSQVKGNCRLVLTDFAKDHAAWASALRQRLGQGVAKREPA